jgi:acid phosphatase type 7
MTRHRLRISSFVAVLLLVVGLGSAQPAPLTLVKSPYLQRVTPTGITVRWETDRESTSRLEYAATGAARRSVYDPVLRSLHAVTLAGLQPDTTYSYWVSSAVQGVAVEGPAGAFTTAPAGPSPFRFAVCSDSQAHPDEYAKIVRGLLATHPRFVLHAGDMTQKGREAARWTREFFGPAASLLATTPVYPALGNHEGGSSLYYRYFTLPLGGGRENEEWYSFDYGDAHFVVLDTNVDFSPGSAQYAWLEKDLKATRAQWLFVVHHQPVFSSGMHGGSEKEQRYLVPLYQTYHVDAVFSGHDHQYERSDNRGVVYFVTGGGGGPLYPVNVSLNPFQRFAESTHHFCTVDIRGPTATIRALYPDGKAFDSVTLKHAPGFRRMGK